MQAGKQHTSKLPLVPPACTAPMASQKREAALGASTGAARAGHRGRLGRRFGLVRGHRGRLDRAGLGDQALVRGLAPRVVDGARQGQDSGPVHPERHSLALAPLPDPAQLGPVLQQHQVMRCPKTDAAGVKKQIQCGQSAHTDCLWHGGKGGTREGFPDPDPPPWRHPYPRCLCVPPPSGESNTGLTSEKSTWMSCGYGGGGGLVGPPRTHTPAPGLTRGSAPPSGRWQTGGPGPNSFHVSVNVSRVGMGRGNGRPVAAV